MAAHANVACENVNVGAHGRHGRDSDGNRPHSLRWNKALTKWWYECDGCRMVKPRHNLRPDLRRVVEALSLIHI